MQPHDFWQEIHAAQTFECNPQGGHRLFFPAELEDGRQLRLPIRELSDGRHALASLIINQASFEVEDALTAALAARFKPYSPDIIVGLPTLGLTLARGLARHLKHTRYVPLSTSRKFWYVDDLSIPISSITSPGQAKRLYVDPRMLPLLEGKRVALVDDVISTGTSIVAGLALLDHCGIKPVVIGAAMLQSDRWIEKLAAIDAHWPKVTEGVLKTPILAKTPEGGWLPSSPTD
ncbi:MAG: phosphoribosyltransferase [Phyllobacterium sp.]